MKGMKPDPILKTDYIPVEYADVRHTKTAFKKLMRACVPSSTNQEPDQSFLRYLFYVCVDFRITSFLALLRACTQYRISTDS